MQLDARRRRAKPRQTEGRHDRPTGGGAARLVRRLRLDRQGKPGRGHPLGRPPAAAVRALRRSRPLRQLPRGENEAQGPNRLRGVAPGKSATRSLRHPPGVLGGVLPRGRQPVLEPDMQSGACCYPFLSIHRGERPLRATPHDPGVPRRQAVVRRRPQPRVRRTLRARPPERVGGVPRAARRGGFGADLRGNGLLRQVLPRSPPRPLSKRALRRHRPYEALLDAGSSGGTALGVLGKYVLKKSSKLGLGRRVELTTIRRVKDPGFREYAVPYSE